MTGERFPFEPLVAIIEARWRQPNDADGVHLGHIGIEAKTEAVTGMKRGRVRWWRRNGLTLRAADEVAVSLGLHPAQVWPIEWRATAGSCSPLPARVSTPAA